MFNNFIHALQDKKLGIEVIIGIITLIISLYGAIVSTTIKFSDRNNSRFSITCDINSEKLGIDDENLNYKIIFNLQNKGSSKIIFFSNQAKLMVSPKNPEPSEVYTYLVPNPENKKAELEGTEITIETEANKRIPFLISLKKDEYFHLSLQVLIKNSEKFLTCEDYMKS